MPVNFEKNLYSEKEVQEDSALMRKKIEDDEAEDYDESEKIIEDEKEEKIEQKLPPEQIKKVMEKVQDINGAGTAFSVISFEYPTPKLKSGESKLESILKNGLIGTSGKQEGVERSEFNNETNKEAYLDLMKKRIGPEVFFSIVGRLSGDEEWNYSKISEYGYYFSVPKQTLAILFDVSIFNEKVVKANEPLKARSFSAYDGSYGDPSRLDPNEKGKPLPHIEYGFRLSPRVAPKYFKGIVFYMRRELNNEEYENRIKEMLEKNIKNKYAHYYEKDEKWLRDQKEFKYVEETDAQKLSERANEIAEEMINTKKEKPEQTVPIYDVYGNLYWPKQMSYEDVKVFVSDRDKDISEKNN